MEVFMKESSPLSLKGHFLTAMPMLKDPNFSQTVSVMCEHNSEGAVGIVVNRVHEGISGEDIFKELNISYTPGAGSIPVHIGGPVHMGEIFLIHGPPYGWESCIMITSQVAMSNTRDIIESIAMGEGPESFLIALGCAGWSPGQLEDEIKNNAWLTHPVANDIIFNSPIESRWDEAMKRMGIDPAFISETAGNA